MRQRFLFPPQKRILAADTPCYPRVLQPWPLLCVPNDKGELETLCIGGDDGCECGHDPAFTMLRARERPKYFDAGPTKMFDFSPPEKRKALVSMLRNNPEMTLTMHMGPENDPRFHIPDQSVPSNERLPPKLEEFIPKEYLPDVLLVHDPQGVAQGERKCSRDGYAQFKEDVPIRYSRVFPTPMTDGRASNVAHLYLSEGNLCGSGNHSFVYHAPLMLPAPLTARTPSRQVTVLAKISYPGLEHRDLLSQEGLVYDTFPQWMMEDYCGYNIVDQIPVSASAIY
jgi:hypothetical protein